MSTFGRGQKAIASFFQVQPAFARSALDALPETRFAEKTVRPGRFTRTRDLTWRGFPSSWMADFRTRQESASTAIQSPDDHSSTLRGSQKACEVRHLSQTASHRMSDERSRVRCLCVRCSAHPAYWSWNARVPEDTREHRIIDDLLASSDGRHSRLIRASLAQAGLLSQRTHEGRRKVLPGLELALACSREYRIFVKAGRPMLALLWRRRVFASDRRTQVSSSAQLHNDFKFCRVCSVGTQYCESQTSRTCRRTSCSRGSVNLSPAATMDMDA